MLFRNAALAARRLRPWFTIALFLLATLLASVLLRHLFAPLGDSLLAALQLERTEKISPPPSGHRQVQAAVEHLRTAR